MTHADPVKAATEQPGEARSRRTRSQPLTRAVGVAVAALAVSACSSPPPVHADAPQLVVDMLAAARDGGAGRAQIEVLELAASEGRDLTYEEYRLARENQAACLRDGGLEGVALLRRDIGPAIQSDLEYQLGDLTEDQAEAVLAACGTEHADFVSAAYLSQEAFIEWQSATILQYLPEMRTCLADYGITLAEDATVDEIIQANLEMVERGGGPNGISCAEITDLALVLNGML